MKKHLLLTLSLGLLLASCGGSGSSVVESSQPAASSPEATSSQPATQTSSAAQASSSGPEILSLEDSSAAASSAEEVVTDQYLALPFNSYQGSTRSTDAVDKWEKGFTYKWTFKAAKAVEVATLAIGARLTASSHSDRTLFTNSVGADSSDTFESNSANDGTPRLSVKANNVSYALTNHGTYGDAGLSTSGINYIRLTSFALKEGDNAIEITTHAETGYRLQVGGDVRLYYAGEGVEVSSVVEPFVPGDGVFSGLTEFTDPVNIHTEKQQAFIDYTGDYASFTTETIQQYANGNSNASAPKPVHVEWTHAPKEENYNYTVEVSMDSTFPAAATEVYNVNKAKEANLYNFLLGGTYFYRVKANYASASDVSEAKSFTIEDEAPRLINIDGITNCRDLGGRALTNGSKVKQGMIYRTSALNSNVAPAGHITAEGKRVMKEVLGVKSEIELRGGSSGTGGEASSETASDLEGVTFYYSPMAYSGGKNLIYRNIEPIRKIFSVLGNADNYPVFFHCRIGTDRTGAIALLINGLLGVSEQDIYQDYLFSNFGNIGKQTVVGLGNEDSIDGYVNQIKQYPGANFAEKVYNFLLSIGVPSTDLDTIISTLTEGEAKTVNPGETVVKVAGDAVLENANVQISTAYRSAPNYIAMSNASSKATFTVNVGLESSKNVFLQIQSSNGSAKLNEAMTVTIDGEPVTLSNATFAQSDLGLGGDYWIPVQIAANHAMNVGNHTIVITGGSAAFNISHIAVQAL